MVYKYAAYHSKPIPGTIIYAETILHLTPDGHRTLCNRPISRKDRAWDVADIRDALWIARKNRPCKMCQATKNRLEREAAAAVA